MELYIGQYGEKPVWTGIALTRINVPNEPPITKETIVTLYVNNETGGFSFVERALASTGFTGSCILATGKSATSLERIIPNIGM